MAATATASGRQTANGKRERSPRVDRAGGRRRFVVVAFLALALIGTVLVHVWLRLQVVHMGYVL